MVRGGGRGPGRQLRRVRRPSRPGSRRAPPSTGRGASPPAGTFASPCRAGGHQLRERDEPRGAVGRRRAGAGRGGPRPPPPSRPGPPGARPARSSRAASRSRIARSLGDGARPTPSTAASGGGTCSTSASGEQPGGREHRRSSPSRARRIRIGRTPSPVNARRPPAVKASARVGVRRVSVWIWTAGALAAHNAGRRSGTDRPRSAPSARRKDSADDDPPAPTPERPPRRHPGRRASPWAGSRGLTRPGPSGQRRRPLGRIGPGDRARRSSATTRAPRSRSRRTPFITSTTGAASSTPRSHDPPVGRPTRRSSAPSASATSWPTSSSTSTPAPAPTS